MPLAALLIADEADRPRLLGTDLLTVQMQRALGAGATHGIILSPRSSPALVSTMETLRGLGMTVDLARTPAEVADCLHPDERVLIVPEALTIAPAPLTRLASAAAPHLLCVEDRADNTAYELIDATARWTGAAMISGALVRQTAAMVGDWDFASVLLRSAVQAGAGRTLLSASEQRSVLATLGSSDAATAAGRQLIGQTTLDVSGLGTAFIVAPLARWGAQAAAGATLDAGRVGQAALGSMALSALLACAGWITLSLVILLLALIVSATAFILGRAATGLAPYRRLMPRAEWLAGVVVIGGMGTTVTIRTEQWGCALLAAVAIGAIALRRAFTPKVEPIERWGADFPALASIGLVGMIGGIPIISLSAMALYSTFSLAWTLYCDHRERLARS